MRHQLRSFVYAERSTLENARRYDSGLVPTTVPKCSRITAADPKPASAATLLDGQVRRFEQPLRASARACASHAARWTCSRCSASDGWTRPSERVQRLKVHAHNKCRLAAGFCLAFDVTLAVAMTLRMMRRSDSSPTGAGPSPRSGLSCAARGRRGIPRRPSGWNDNRSWDRCTRRGPD